MKLDPRLKAALGEMGEGGSMLLEADGTPAVVARPPRHHQHSLPSTLR